MIAVIDKIEELVPAFKKTYNKDGLRLNTNQQKNKRTTQYSVCD